MFHGLNRICFWTAQIDEVFNFFFLFQELSVNSEQLNNATGGLDQLNSILGVTQRKLNRFKVSIELE